MCNGMKIFLRDQTIVDDEVIKPRSEREFVEKGNNIRRDKQIVYDGKGVRRIFVSKRNHLISSNHQGPPKESLRDKFQKSSKDQYTNSATCDFILLSQLEFRFYLELGIWKLRFFL